MTQQRTKATQIFVNLAVKDLKKAIEFFTKVGFTFEPSFTNDDATCMILGENIFAMLLVEKFFQTFTDKEIINAKKSVEVLVCFAVGDREKVDQVVADAIAAGGTAYGEPKDHGFMYSHGFEDLDGHIWEVMYLVPPDVVQ